MRVGSRKPHRPRRAKAGAQPEAAKRPAASPPPRAGADAFQRAGVRAGPALDAACLGEGGRPLAARLRLAPPGSTVEPKKESAFDRFWRTFGINPFAMLERATTERQKADGAAILGSVRADPLGVDAFRGELREVIRSLKADDPAGLTDAAMARFKQRFAEVAGKYGVQVVYKEGAPTVNWADIPTLEVMSKGTGLAAHEMIHAVQCAVGGVAALCTAASDRVLRETGRPPATEAELRSAVARLTPAERQAAFAQIVKPMETQAYANYEEAAFDATGLFGRKSKDVDRYVRALERNLDSFADAYERAQVPTMKEGLGAKIYGSIGHIARTHGETTLLVAGNALLYAKLASMALALNPIAGALALAPLGYLVYRSVTG